MKYETANSLTFLVDSTVIDTYSYNLFEEEEEEYIYELPRLLKLDNYYSLTSHVRYTTFVTVSQDKLYSEAIVYKNSIWLERELTEMYGTVIQTRHDARNLLLEYSFSETPMVKTYPAEGCLDVYYDFFRDQMCYVEHDYVEL